MRRFINLVENATPSVAAIKTYAAKIGVVLDIFETDEYIALEWIERRKTTPRGAGAQVMDAICLYADNTQKIVLLDPDGGNPVMEEYYSYWDFEDLDKIEDHYPDWPQMMIRHPE